MSEIIERAAKAHYEASHDMRVELPWADCHPGYRAQKVAAMRAAVEAMREPTTHMLFEGVVALDGAAEVQGVYTAMLDAALTETP